MKIQRWPKCWRPSRSMDHSPPKHDNFHIIFMRFAVGCPQHNKHQMKGVQLFPTTLKFKVRYLLQQLYHICSVDIFPENFNNILSSRLQTKLKPLLWKDNSTICSLFLLDKKYLTCQQVQFPGVASCGRWRMRKTCRTALQMVQTDLLWAAVLLFGTISSTEWHFFKKN